MKTLLKILVVVVLLLVVGAVILYLNAGSVIKAGIEKVGPGLTGTTVTVESVDFSATSGSLTLHGLHVGNPEGFSENDALRFGRIHLAVDPSTVLSDHIMVEAVEIDEGLIRYERKLTKDNLGAILKNVQAATAGSGEATPAEEDPAAGKKVTIRTIDITGTKVSVGASVAGIGGGAPVPLGDIHLKDLGTESDGISIASAVAKIMTAVIGGAVKAITGAGGDVLEGTAGLATGTLKGVTEGLGKGIGGLFGGGSKEEESAEEEAPAEEGQ